MLFIIEVLSRYTPGGTEEDCEQPHESQHPCRNSNLAIVTSRPTCSVYLVITPGCRCVCLFLYNDSRWTFVCSWISAEIAFLFNWKMSSYAFILLPLGCNTAGSRSPARTQPCGVATGRTNDGQLRFAVRTPMCADGKVSLAVSPTFPHSRSWRNCVWLASTL
jgi:hypothetical protein